MFFVLQTANVAADAKNCVYPNRAEIMSGDALKAAVHFDHVCGEFKKNYRNISNFLKSNVIVMDCDNDHSDDPDDWITFEKLEDLFEEIDYVAVPSRNHMKEKDGRAARPKFHVYFPIEETEDADYYAAVKRTIQKAFPIFDDNALDAARFIFGSDPDEVVWHEGWMLIEEEVTPDYAGADDEDTPVGSGPITVGNRNNAMSHFAGRVLKKYGITDKAKEAFLEHAKRCDPPLEQSELATIWGSAVRFYKKTVMTQPGYIPPDEYNAEFESLKPDDYSDIGEARVLVREYAGELLYTDATEFLSYDGICWRENRQKAVGTVEEFLDMQLVDARTQYSAAMQALIDGGIPEEVVRAGGKALEKLITPDLNDAYKEYLAAKAYYAFVMKYRNYKNIVNTQSAAKPMVATDINLFDAQENYLNTPEATYDLKKGLDGAKLHNSADLLTKITNAAPGDEGRDLWEAALQLFFCGDQDLIDYVQETVGLAAIGKVYEEALIIAYGEGRNGKSTFWNTVSRVLGTYSGAISADALTAGCRRNVKPEIAELKGKRLIIAAELEEGMRLSTSILKQLCSTDQIRGEKKFKDPFDFTPSHTVVLYTNQFATTEANHAQFFGQVIVDITANQVTKTATATGNVVIPSVPVDEPEPLDPDNPDVIGNTEEQTVSVELPVSWTEDGHADVIFTFEFNNQMIPVHYPQENWHTGRHTILLYYPIENVVPNYTNTFNVYMRCSGGTAFVDTGFCIASISGQSMGASAAWDGRIDIEEYVDLFVMGNGTNPERLQVKAFTESQAWEIKETVKRFYSDVKAGRTSIGGFAMPVDVPGSNS